MTGSLVNCGSKWSRSLSDLTSGLYGGVTWRAYSSCQSMVRKNGWAWMSEKPVWGWHPRRSWGFWAEQQHRGSDWLQQQQLQQQLQQLQQLQQQHRGLVIALTTTTATTTTARTTTATTTTATIPAATPAATATASTSTSTTTQMVSYLTTANGRRWVWE